MLNGVFWHWYPFLVLQQWPVSSVQEVEPCELIVVFLNLPLRDIKVDATDGTRGFLPESCVLNLEVELFVISTSSCQEAWVLELDCLDSSPSTPLNNPIIGQVPQLIYKVRVVIPVSRGYLILGFVKMWKGKHVEQRQACAQALSRSSQTDAQCADDRSTSMDIPWLGSVFSTHILEPLLTLTSEFARDWKLLRKWKSACVFCMGKSCS